MLRHPRSVAKRSSIRAPGVGSLLFGAMVAVVAATGGRLSAAENLVVRRDQPPAEAAVARERAALAFAAEHHPELVPLLERLRDGAADEFTAAIADLERTRERIEKLRERQPERHEAELADWKSSSRIRLALARLSTSPSAEAERELRQLLRERHERRLATLRAERERISARLEKIDAQLAAHDADPETAIDKEFTALRAKADAAGRRPLTKPDKPAVPNPKPKAGNPTPASPESGRQP
jgi:hypothetical protein